MPANGLWENRASAYCAYDAPGVPLCSIYVTGYNRLVKTKYCVACVLQYTQDVDYELILIDNGSDDGTYEYFQSVQYEKKRILKITKNVGGAFPFKHVFAMATGKYMVGLPNDVYVTKDWLSNLLKCYESDKRIGFVVPCSSNVSNLQQVDLNFKDFEDMQKKAAAFNNSDPLKWEERMRLVSVLTIWSRQVLDALGAGDAAFVHDFGEDDLCVRLRRSGYKLMFCGDTWVCHDHDFRNMEDKDPVAFQKSIENGRATYYEKYNGIDAWDDINNFERTLFSLLKTAPIPAGKLQTLVIDGRCGTPVLELHNQLKLRGITNTESHTFTTDAKYYVDLQTAADHVQCDRIDFIQSCYADNTFDVVVLCEPINTYASPITLLQRLYNFLKPKGLLLFKLRNADNYNAFLRSAGIGGVSDGDLPSALPLNEVQACLKLFGGQGIADAAEYETLSLDDRNSLLQMLRSLNPKANSNDLKRLITKDYIVRVMKG